MEKLVSSNTLWIVMVHEITFVVMRKFRVILQHVTQELRLSYPAIFYSGVAGTT